MTKLCVSLIEKDTDRLLAAMHSLPPQVELAEVRLDAMEQPDLERICAGKDRPIIITNRPVRAGGLRRQPEKRRLGPLRRAAELGADYVDVELDSTAQLGPLPGPARRIVSYHDFERTPEDLETILRRVLDTRPDVAKVAVTARDAADMGPVLRLLERHAARVPLIALSMGEEGTPSRVLAAKFGAFLTYASATAGKEAAPGQVAVEQMLGMYRLPRISHSTAVYGVVANPVAHSMSPAIHNTAFAATGFDAVYLPFKVTDVAAFLSAFAPYDLKGLSVTIPHKEAMLALMDEVEPLARRVGAVNTVVIREGRRFGYNTDVQAAVSAIEAAVRRAGLGPLSSGHALLIGAGGAARAIAYGLQGKVARLTIANRTVERGRKLAAELGAEACGLHQVTHLQPDVLINASSVGMWPRVQDCPVPDGLLRKGMVVFDSVYNPIKTRLLAQAEGAGAATASGVEWFVNQAAAQFELWTGLPAPREVMDRTVRTLLETC